MPSYRTLWSIRIRPRRLPIKHELLRIKRKLLTRVIQRASHATIMRVRRDHIQATVEERLSFEALYGKTNLKHVHVALLYRRGKLLGMATNFIGSRKKGCGYDHRTIHAERAVLKKVGDTKALEGAILIVIRIAKGTREIMNSEPCHSCRCHLEKCIKSYGLRSIYYSI